MNIKTLNTRSGKVGIVSSKDFMNGGDCNSYTPLLKNDAVYSCINYIAKLVASLSIKQYEYMETGGKVSIYDGITRKLNDTPNEKQTRYAFIYELVSTILADGVAYAIMIPQTVTVEGEKKLGIGEIILVDGVGFDGENYIVDNQIIEPKDIMVFESSTIDVTMGSLLKSILNNLKLADETKSVFYGGAYMPNLIFKMNSESDIWSEEERTFNDEGAPIITQPIVQKIIDRFFKPKKGDPMLIPDQLFDVEQVKPLSLKDIAINESVQLDKKRISSIFGVSAYVVGEGTFNKDEFQHDVITTITPLCVMIEKEITRKILKSPMRAFSFNVDSLLRGNVAERTALYTSLTNASAIKTNEIREREGLDWIEGGDEIIVVGGGVAETVATISDKGGGKNG